jgi:hypothetical protein
MAASLVYLSASARGYKTLFASGVLWGLAFTCNNRISYLPAVLLIAELADWRGITHLVKRGAAIGLGGLAPLAIIESAYLAARAFGRAAGARVDWLDYLQQLAAFTRMNPPDRLRPDEWPTYFVDIALMDGIAVLALLLVGIAVLLARLRRRPWRRADLLLFGSLLVPLALYSIYSTGEVRLRHFSLAIPWVMLAAALGLDWLASFARQYRTHVTALATAVLVIVALPRVAALDSAPNGMPAVLNFVGSQPVASTNGPVQAFFVGEDRSNARLREAFVNVPADLGPLAQQFPLLVVDVQAAVFPGELTDIYARATPRLTMANGNDAWYLADLLEHYGIAWGGWNDLLARWEANRAIASQLRVYQLAELVP